MTELPAGSAGSDRRVAADEDLVSDAGADGDDADVLGRMAIPVSRRGDVVEDSDAGTGPERSQVVAQRIRSREPVAPQRRGRHHAPVRMQRAREGDVDAFDGGA